MPIYDYHCDQCGTTFETRLTFQEKEVGKIPACPNCSSLDTQQLISAGMFLRTGTSQSGNMSAPACGPRIGGGCCG
ncbi:MAG: zinc ribbon domain-containing protein [Brevefilum sp.]|nr:zinc ribbon domain-containing protein [Brevefilum sp.]